MKITGILIAAFVFFAVHTTQAGDQKNVRLHGQVVNVEGFSATVLWDAESMKKAAAEGKALGFYDSRNEKLYVVRAKGKDANGVNEMLLPYIGMRVNVRGTTSLEDKVNYLDLTNIEKRVKEKK